MGGEFPERKIKIGGKKNQKIKPIITSNKSNTKHSIKE
jgi:hypothetical protein